ncbi:hypothetical protein [Oleiagrimonas soli]|uniref:Lipoprotein n=1 Tax=Oleiagrimonas soli TaxID=1543381 RepID=A0A099CSP4_9GAMM|nr:hypothetical protein [Oleiagrimonas soli]KGI76998.1 hypothetical protein LF63_0112050 [Oleiagrimonas soli]MBB6185492.1 hypothetical protein [Oleiagrimonas soli]
MKTPPRLPLLLATLLVCTLSACSMQKLAERITPNGDLALVHALFTDLRAGHTEAARAHFDKQREPSEKTLDTLAAMLAETPNPELVGANVTKQNSNPWQTTLTYQFGHGEQVRTLMLHIDGTNGHRRIDTLLIGNGPDMHALMRIVTWVFVGLLIVLAAVAVLVIWLVRRNRRQYPR